jgi:hypothetical protein
MGTKHLQGTGQTPLPLALLPNVALQGIIGINGLRFGSLPAITQLEFQLFTIHSLSPLSLFFGALIHLNPFMSLCFGKKSMYPLVI